MKAIANAIRFLVFTNTYISICLFCFTAKTSLMLYGTMGNMHVNALVFFSTLFLYSFHKVYRRFRLLEEEHKEERHHWVDDRKKMYYIIIVFALVMAIIQLFYMPLRVLIMLVPVALIAAGYSIPFIKTSKGYIRIRDVLWLKALWIALSCAWLTTLLPVAFMYPLSYLKQPQVLFLFAENLLFIFVLAIPFDIRDVAYDKRNGVNTLPILLGVKGVIKLCLALLGCFAVLVFFHYRYSGLSGCNAVVLVLSAIEAACFVSLCKPERPNLFFHLAIESAMLLQWALIYLVLALA